MLQWQSLHSKIGLDFMTSSRIVFLIVLHVSDHVSLDQEGLSARCWVSRYARLMFGTRKHTNNAREQKRTPAPNIPDTQICANVSSVHTFSWRRTRNYWKQLISVWHNFPTHANSTIKPTPDVYLGMLSDEVKNAWSNCGSQCSYKHDRKYCTEVRK